MSELPIWARDALAEVHDPCCRERGLSVIDMGLVRSVRVEHGRARVELMLTSGWGPFAASVLTQVKERITAQPGVDEAEVEIVWDEPWTTDRLSPRARTALRFLPSPAEVPDPRAYVEEHQLVKE
jgi:metal-sulfur cluster biosynthetic enzyme